MRKMIAAGTIAAFIAGLSLAQHAVSQSGYGGPATDVGSPPHEFPLLAPEAGTSGSVNAPWVKVEGTPSGGPRATAAQIERLATIQRSPAMNPSATSRFPSANVCVEHYLRAVDPNNRDWNPSDPRWDTMRTVIAQDCTVEVNGYREKVAPALQKAYAEAIRKSYGNHLSSTDADTLIRFYDSDAGHRFLSFQEQLVAAGRRGMGRLFSGNAGPDSQASAPEVTKARMQLLRLSRPVSMLIVATEDARRAGADTSGGPAIAIMMHVTAERQGEALDQIAHEYSADLHNFAEFVESPPEVDELRALYEATHAAMAAAGKIVVQVNLELNGSLNRWRDLYHSLPRNQ
jgi:hypothetical protein